MNAQATMEQGQVTMDAGRQVLSLKGPVSFDTAPLLADEGRRLLKQVAPETAVLIDASGVQYSSSATLTVVLEWWRALNVRQLQLKDVLLPQQMRPLVALSGLKRILPER